MTDGINLAINFGDKQCDMTKFYEERVIVYNQGLLMNFKIDENIDYIENEKLLNDMISGHIKI